VLCARLASKTQLWDIRFQDLGRTNKSIPTAQKISSDTIRWADFDAPFEEYTFEPFTARSNLKGRYGGPHLHFVGHKGQKAWVDQVRDCIVQSGVGWDYVQHGCYALFQECVSHNFKGAGFVGEVGNEDGAWHNCVAAGCRSDSGNSGYPKSGQNSFGDNFRQGYGFATRGRVLRITNCTAVGAPWAHVIFTRDYNDSISPKIDPDRNFSDVSDLIWGFYISGKSMNEIHSVHNPILHWENNEAIGCYGGLSIIKNATNQHHDISNNLVGFRAWGTTWGVAHDYLGKYNNENWLLIYSDFIGIRGRLKRIAASAYRSNYQNYQNIIIEGHDDGFVFEEGQPPSGTNVNAKYSLPDEPKWVISNSPVNTATTPIKALRDTEVYLPYLLESAGPFTQQPLVINLPAKLADWNEQGNLSNLQTGTKSDSVSSAWPIPGAADTYGVLHEFYGKDPFDPQNAANRFDDLIQTYGYHTIGGNPVITFPLHWTDTVFRFSTKKTMHYVEVTSDVSSYTNLGAITPSASDPTASPINRTLAVGATDSFNVLTESAAAGAAGTTLTCGDPYMNGLWGNVSHRGASFGFMTIAENGDLTYKPHDGYVGTDHAIISIYDGGLRFVDVLVTFTMA